MSSGTVAVIKNKSTERNREFWSHVESVAAQSRSSRASMSNESLFERRRVISESNSSTRPVVYSDDSDK